MMNLIFQIFLFGLIGIIIGVFGTLLFFRLDKGWKQILLGLGSFFSAGGAGVIFISYLNVDKSKISIMILSLLVGLIVSVYFSFSKLCVLLKNQTGKNTIRVLDILLGYDGFIKDYYENRKKDIIKSISLEEINDRESQLEKKEKQLAKLQEYINEQNNNKVYINLPENSQIALTNNFVRKIPSYVERLCRFTINIENLTNSFVDELSAGSPNSAELLKGYFAGIGMFIANDLFRTISEDVRTHFRILKNNTYIQYAVVLGNKLSVEKISDIPKGKSMITKSFELRKSLVASLNPHSSYDTKTRWDDYITITYYNFKKNEDPFLSMGISVKNSQEYCDMLYFLNFFEIENTLQAYIDKVNKVCNIVDALN